ncbi:MAG TPA: RHS repeat-associated core domain-containing protein, partial [Candidatus Dormibacteraeota bacterium]|nr:RHS repeat-associated core domain-containing protein [Candidatus Dormibacteraeota bacterium]
YSMSYSYDLAGHVNTITYPSGHTVNYTFDAAGRTQTFTGNLGDGAQRNYATGISYSPAGALSQEQFGTAPTPVYNKLFYNSRQQLAEIRESTTPNDTSWNRGAIINFYSSQCWGMCSGYSMPDNNGNLKKQEVDVPADDSSFTSWYQQYTYDTLNRLQQVNEYTGTPSLDWHQAYIVDRWGNRTIDVNNTSPNIPHPVFNVDTTTNRLTVPTGYSGVLGYDNAGNLTNDRYPNAGQGQRIFDAENRMTQASANSQWQVYSYDGEGRRVRRKVNGVETWQVYGLGGELLAEYAAKAPAAIPDKEYGYRNGQLLVTASAVNLALNQLATQSSTFVNGGITFSAGRAVDGNTNGDLWGGNTSSATNNEYQPWWQVDLGSSQWLGSIQVWPRTDCCPETTANFYVLVSDNPFTSTDLTTTLNQAGVSNYWVLGNTASPSTVNINRTGRYVRIQRNDTQYLVLAEVRVIASTADVRWLVSDQLGTPRMIFDKTGSLANVSRHDYLPFGEELVAGSGYGLRTPTMGYGASDGERQKFTQKERDNETGLDYFGARYYANIQGRFTSVDPLMASGNAGSPQSWNRYAYVLNNPLRLTDPTGMSALDPDPVNDPKDAKYFPLPTQGQNSSRQCTSATPCQEVSEEDAKKAGPESALIRYTVTVDIPKDDTPISTTDPVLPSSAVDYVPVVGTGRQFLFHYTTQNFEGALFDFGKMSAELGTLPVLGSAAVGRAFATEAGEAIFYSGGKAAFEAATEAAVSEGGKTILQTTGGNLLNKVTDSNVVWRWASKQFAQGASGDVRVFLREPLRARSTWQAVEYPILKAKPWVRLIFR